MFRQKRSRSSGVSSRWLVCAFGMAAVLSACGPRDQRFAQPAEVAQLPSPNGYDDFIAAGKMSPRDLSYPECSSPKEVADQVTEHQDAFMKAREGLTREVVVPWRRTESDKRTSEVFPLIRLGRFFLFEAADHIQKADFLRARNSYLDMLDFGTRIDQRGTLVDKIGSTAIIAMATMGLDPLVDKVPPAEAGPTARMIEKRLAQQYAFADTMRQEYLLWEKEAEDAKKKSLFAYLKLAVMLPRMSDFYSDMAGLSRTIPFRSAVTALKKKWSRGSYEFFFTGAVGQMDKLHYANSVTHLTALKFALRGYHLKYRHYPESLEALIPDFLERVPTDPYTGRAFIYRTMPAGYALYSGGPDEHDDGGIAPQENQFVSPGWHEPVDVFGPIRFVCEKGPNKT